LIEVKTHMPDTKTIKRQAKKSIEEKPDIENFLLVLNESVTSEKRKKIIEVLETTELNPKIWDKRKIRNLKKSTQNVAQIHKDENLIWHFERFKDIPVNENKEKYIEKLKNAFQNEKLVLFLGAGVSIDSGLLDLSNLTKKILSNAIQDRDEEIIEDQLYEYLENQLENYSNITIVRFIKDILKDDFRKKVKEALYSEYSFDINQEDLMYEIRKLCTPERNIKGIKAVVTYNFDNLLEMYLNEQNINYNIIKGEDDSPNPDELSIYHVHGYLPYGEEPSENNAPLIFSEQEYHEQYKDPYSWQNLSQLNLLRENTALFIGLSMQDPNLRRLLDISSTKSPKSVHYSILKNDWENENQHLENVFRSVEESTFKDLGVRIIWTTNHKKKADILNDLNSTI
ncbi:MAG: SIR2 family protein, partial [archaeon]